MMRDRAESIKRSANNHAPTPITTPLSCLEVEVEGGLPCFTITQSYVRRARSHNATSRNTTHNEDLHARHDRTLVPMPQLSFTRSKNLWPFPKFQ